MIVDHLGVVVKSIEEGILHWSSIFGYTQMTEVVINSRQKVKVVFMKKEGSILIKLVEPIDQSSPAFGLAKKGGGLHHIGFKCDNINEQIKTLQEKKLRLISPPEPGEAFGNNPIAFMFAKQGLNIELIDSDIKAKLIE